MIPFQPYPKIPESTKDWRLNADQWRSLNRLSWVATEKIHGANMCLCTDGYRVSVAKRRALLSVEDAFFDYQYAMGPLQRPVKQLHDQLRSRLGCHWLFVYGELAGGSYPHDQVTPIPGCRAVQTGVYYSPEIMFIAFDLAWTDSDGLFRFTPFQQAHDWLSAVNIHTTPVIASGELSRMLNLPAVFSTHVPGQLQLPAIEDNVAEGYVVKPWDNVDVFGEKFYSVKIKNPDFSERHYHQAQTWGQKPDSDPLAGMESRALQQLTKNRLDSAVSKIGRPTSPGDKHTFTAITHELGHDIREEMETRHGDLLLGLDHEDLVLLWSVIDDACIRFVQQNLLRTQDLLDPNQYYTELAWAYLRGHLPGQHTPAELLERARQQELRLHKFKRKQGPPRVTQVLSILEGLQPKNLLDIGSGRGAFLWPLLGRFPDLPVTCVDRLNHRVNTIVAVRRGGIQNVNAIAGDVCSLGFDSNAFDAVTILEVLEHLIDPEPAAAEVLRVARRFVIASVPSHADNNPEHLRLFNKQSLSQLFYHAGAHRVQISYVLNHMIAVVRVAESV